ncbi:RDD family protein [Mycobacterium sp. Y57]|uniref:RDD family protein n=1 Tax=Mycolicibacterium xanthum TaxID=2796469 RepID=UPI001C84CAEC|nr:RDD family protein [Mycolicibacterium xanthum]MBX7434266.1 RDD family protein [Mycolicibacterium xanthum]
MTTVLDTTPATPADDPTPEDRPASWPARATALAVDLGPGLAVIATAALCALAAPADGWQRYLFGGIALVVLFATALNRLVLPHATGWTLGRALVGIRVYRRAGEPVGVVRLTARECAHLLDTAALFVGWLWPLWDRRGRTFADLLARTEVRRVVRPRRDMHRTVGWVLVATAVACVATVGLGYAVVYRPQLAVDRAGAQIREQGPRIVEQMLSYGADSLPEDFARAQSLTTDAYRPQLIAQQQAVQQAGATGNEYWAVASALLTDPPVTTDHAAMLMAMQGQRGTNPEDLKFITATVRVEFDRSADGQWRVANLTVLKKPLMGRDGR